MPCAKLRKEAQRPLLSVGLWVVLHIPIVSVSAQEAESAEGLFAKKRTCMFKPWLCLLNLPNSQDVCLQTWEAGPWACLILMGLVLTDSEKGNFVKQGSTSWLRRLRQEDQISGQPGLYSETTFKRKKCKLRPWLIPALGSLRQTDLRVQVQPGLYIQQVSAKTRLNNKTSSQ